MLTDLDRDIVSLKQRVKQVVLVSRSSVSFTAIALKM